MEIFTHFDIFDVLKYTTCSWFIIKSLQVRKYIFAVIAIFYFLSSSNFTWFNVIIEFLELRAFKHWMGFVFDLSFKSLDILVSFSARPSNLTMALIHKSVQNILKKCVDSDCQRKQGGELFCWKIKWEVESTTRQGRAYAFASGQ